MDNFDGFLLIMVNLIRPFKDDYHMLEGILENLKKTPKKAERCSISVMLDENIDRLGLIIDAMDELRKNITKPSVCDCINNLIEELQEIETDYIFLALEFEDYLCCPALDEQKG